jgi:flagellin
MGAIDVLRGIDRTMERTQSRVASGLGVATASDNAAYWSISTTMRSDDRAMSAVEDALALGAATVDTAYIGITNALDVMSEMKAKLVAAREPGIDRAKIDGEIKQLTAQLRSISESSSFNGENWLVTQNGAVEPTRSLVTSFIRSSDNSVRVGAVEYGMDLPDGMSNRLIDESDNVQSGGWHGLLTNNAMPMGFDMTGPLYDVLILAKNSPWDLAEELRVDDSKSTYEIDGMIEYVEYTERQMISVAAHLGSLSSNFERQTEFVKDLRDISMKGVGRLRDADMNQESARLKALQTQQQLGLQALSIANSKPATMLSLFN